MNTKEALEQFAEYPPMIVRDLTGTVRKQVIQVDVMRFEAIMSAVASGHSSLNLIALFPKTG